MVPIVARDVKADTVPEALRKLNWIFYRDSDDFEKATDELISALDTDLNWVHAHTRLLTRAIEWNANGKNNSFVLRGDDLRSAERWLAEAGAQKDRQPTALQTEYIIASRKAAARRQRITLGAVTFGFVVAIVLAVLAFFAEAKAKEQTKKTSEGRQPGKCFARSVLKRRRQERSSLGPTCAGVAAESGKSGSLWLDGRYADTTKLACSVNRFNAA